MVGTVLNVKEKFNKFWIILIIGQQKENKDSQIHFTVYYSFWPGLYRYFSCSCVVLWNGVNMAQILGIDWRSWYFSPLILKFMPTVKLSVALESASCYLVLENDIHVWKNSCFLPDVVAYAHNLSMLRAEKRGSQVWDQPAQVIYLLI